MEHGRQKSMRYWGAWPFKQLCTMTLTCSDISSQCAAAITDVNSVNAGAEVLLMTVAGDGVVE